MIIEGLLSLVITYLHSTMLLLKYVCRLLSSSCSSDLHSTMLLLKLCAFNAVYPATTIFTFHYATT